MSFKIKITFLLSTVLIVLVAVVTGQTNSHIPVEYFLKIETQEERVNFIDSIHYKLENIDKLTAIEEWENLISICKKVDYRVESGFCYFFKSIILKNAAEYFLAYNALIESNKIFEKENHLKGMARVNNSLGILYKNLNDFDQSLVHYEKSEMLFTELKDFNRLGWIYLNIGVLWEKQDSLENAKKYLWKSKYMLEKFYDPTIMSCYINLGDVYNSDNNIDSAYYYYSESYRLSQSKGNLEDKFLAPYHFVKFLFSIGRISEAEPIIEEISELQKNTNVDNLIEYQHRANYAHLLSEYFEYKQDYSSSLYYLKQAVNFELQNKREQSLREVNKSKINALEEEREKELNRRLWTTYISIAVFLGLMLLVFSFYRSYKHKKEANKLLTEMDELKTRLFSNITHELRTPLTLIIGPLEQMLSSETHKTPSRKQIKTMRKNANSLLNLVNQMLDLSKIDAKSMKLELTECDIHKFLKSRFAAFSSLADQKSISYQYSLLKGKNLQIFDTNKVEKIINNLVSNALKFTPKNGKIECLVKFPESNQLELIIADNGKGIPGNEVNMIFNRFHQVNTNSELANVGTGIGLSLTKELVELLHGTIDVKSEVSKGTKFTLLLPLGIEHLREEEYILMQSQNVNHEKEITEIPTSDNFPQIKNSNDNHKLPLVLVVEDNPDIREFIVENLSFDYQVEEAKNGKAGIKKAISNIPDLIITDVVMPKKDGIELSNTLKNDEKTSHIPIIMLTGKSGIEDKLAGLNTGVDAYLTKPFNISELKIRVLKLIEQRKKLRERFEHNLRLEPKEIAVTSLDDKFISKAMEVIEKNISNSEFEVRQFQDEMLMSRMQLFRKIKAITNQTPSEFIRTIRLKRAASLIQQNYGNIAQITFEVGFNNPSYFAKCFKDLFGELPSEYAKTQQIKT